MKIVAYEPAFGKAFYELNIEWLESYFYVEPYDREVLSDPKKYILNPGGFIFFATQENRCVGTVALLNRGENRFELTKMAVLPKLRGQKIGQRLLNYCIDFAKQQGFNELYLYSNTILENAIYIYRKLGFVEVPVEPDSPYERSNIKMVYPLVE